MVRKTNVLIVFANPIGYDPLRLAEEDRVIRECVRRSRYRNAIHLDIKHAATVHDLRRALLDGEYQIVHFSGHGTGMDLAFHDEEKQVKLVSADALSELLSAYSPPINCVILNACYSSQLVSSLNVPYIITAEDKIFDADAIEFTRGFYDAIGADRDVRFAYGEGCRTVKLMNPTGTIPVMQEKRLGNPSEPPLASPTLDKEWVVQEARESDFLNYIRIVHDIVKSHNEGVELVITLYARSFPEQMGVGSFEHDLLYYRNVNDPAPMFGPIVQNDDRIRITEIIGESYRIKQPIYKGKIGGFSEREKIIASAWFKLSDGHWSQPTPLESNMKSSSIKGLLFINARNATFNLSTFDSENFQHALANLEIGIANVIEERKDKFNRKILALENTITPTSQIDYLAHTKKANDIGVDDINNFFSEFMLSFEKISERQDVAFTVFGYDKGRNCLNWLWSNGPTSVSLSTHLPSENFQGIVFLPIQVALDANRKPLLIHNLSMHFQYKERAIVTRFGDNSQVNLIVPVLSKSEPKSLLGILDVQGVNADEFDTDDIQLLYRVSGRYLADFMEKLKRKGTERDNILIPFYTNRSYMPFKKQSLEFDNVDELMMLIFNEMKYLLHWDNIKKVVMEEDIPFPPLVEIWPSMNCNHKCIWCRTKHDRLSFKNNHFISFEGLNVLAHDLINQENVDILLSGGGEPLLHPDIHKFMELLKEVEGTIGVFTNGTRPKGFNFNFWNHFYEKKNRYSFVRISLNCSDPENYFRIHFDNENGDIPPDYRKYYAGVKKNVLDLLGMRTGKSTVAIGTTVHSNWRETIEAQIKNARQMGVDFIQMRPELFESSQNPDIGWAIRNKIITHEKSYGKDFSVKYTDGERTFKNHDYDICYAMYLVPALIPDIEKGWIQVMPCSYAQTRASEVPLLGRMREGTKLSEFWDVLNDNMSGIPHVRYNADSIKDLRDKPINPKEGCPQCRYYMLNKRIIAIKNNLDKIHLITKLVKCLKENSMDFKDDKLVNDIESTWSNEIIDVEKAKKAFMLSRKFNIRPSL